MKTAEYLIVLILSFSFDYSLLANAIGSDFQNFNPTSNGLDFITVQSSESLKPGIFNLGLFLNYAVNPLPEFEDENKHRGEIRNTLTTMDFNLGLGLSDSWDIGINIPAIISQTVREENTRVQFSNRGVNEFRLNSKYRLLGDDRGGIAFIGTINFHAMEKNPYTGKNPGPTLNAEIAGDVKFKHLALGANLGYRKRQSGESLDEVPVEPLLDQWLYSVAISHLLDPIDTQVIGEIYGTQPAEERGSTTTKRSLTSAEALVGLKHYLNHNIAFHGGIGTYIDKTATSPDSRIYAGINWIVGPVWNHRQETIRQVQKSKVPASPNPAPQIYTLEGVEFDFDSSTKVLKGSLIEVDRLGKKLATIPFIKLVIAGHTDSLGSDTYNQKLSEKRAENIKDYLVKKFGIPEHKIKVIGHGESQPIADNATFQGRQQNRRVEFQIFE